MLLFILVQLVSYAGLMVVKRLAKNAGRAQFIATIWAVMTSFALIWSYSCALVSVMEHSETVVVGAGVACSIMILLYIWIGLGRLWPTTYLGFAWVGVPKLAAGVAVGCVLVTALSPHVWNSVIDPPQYMRDYLIVTGVIPLSTLEEVVFRGRVMELVCTKIRSSEMTLLVQALLFVALHMIHLPLSLSGGRDTPAVLRRLSIIFMTAYAYGLLRQRTGSLWAPVGAHVTYNILATLNNLDTIG